MEELDKQINLGGNNDDYGNQQNQNQDKTDFNTLDEEISTTLKRDLNIILEKTKVAMLPMKAGTNPDIFKDWDFWGPLIFCMLLGVILSIGIKDQQTGLLFILVFVIVWIGGLIVSLNSQFLGVKLSLCQCICLLGYCMCAIVVSALVNSILSFLPMFINLIIAMGGFGYSSYGKLYIFV